MATPRTPTAEDTAKSNAAAVAKWIKEIDACKKREADFRKDGQRILELYDGTKAEQTPFNILYSNTETLMPALYSAVPRPVVQRRFKDEDPLGKAAAQAGQRVLEFLLDTNLDQYETFDDGMKAATLDALLPGRAATAVVYDAELLEAEPGDGDESPVPVMKSELVCIESKPWKQVYYGYARKWAEVPWLAYESEIDRPEAVRLLGEEAAAKLTFTKGQQQADRDEEKDKADRHQGERETCRIYQIWDKDGGRKVRYLSDTYKDDFLKEEDDPLQLTGFFNCPKPLQFLAKTHSLTPTALYVLYESQAKELNELTRRIKSITKAIKARGIYDSELGDDLKKLMEADDNDLVPADKSSSLAAEKGLQNAIWFMPVQELIITLRELLSAREQCKQVIYEITGISDIIRGASKASETLGAQEIKTQWGTLRLKRAQKEVARYAKDLLRLMLELAATKFSEETWAKMTGLPFLLSARFNELTAVAQALTVEVQRVQAIQPPPQPGLPPQVPPQVQELQQIQQQLQAPKWADVLAMLRDDLHRAYRIDVETNSTVEPEAAEDQKNISEVLTAMGQVLNGVAPLVANGTLPFQAAQVMLLTIIRRFRFGSDLEDTVKAMQPPTPPDDGQGAEQVKQAQALAEKELAMQQRQADSDLKMKQMDAEMRVKQREMDLQLREAQLKVDQEVFKISQQAAQQQQQAQAQVQQAALGADEKVRQEKDRLSQREQQLAKQADGKVNQSVTALKQTAQQVQQLGAALHAIQQQAADTQAVLAQLLKAATAKRVKRAIRGADQRIERVEEEIVA